MAKAETRIIWYGEDLMKAIENATDDGLLAGAEKLIELSKSSVPVQSGTLRDSAYSATVTQSDYKAKKGVHMKEIKVKKGEAVAAYAAFYGRFIESGTIHLPARPFLRNNFDSNKSMLAKIIVGEMADDLK